MQGRDGLDVRTVATALAHQTRDIALELLGEPTSRGAVEWRWGRKGSLAVHVAGPKQGRFFDNEAGVHGDLLDLFQHKRGGTLQDAMTWGRGRLCEASVPWTPPATARPSRPPPVAVEATPDADLEKRSAIAQRLWREARPVAGSPVETYLHGRGLELPTDAPLRFHPACPRSAERLPAMVALMTDPVTGAPSGGVHRTFLTPDGRNKAPGQAKMMLGPGGVIRLVPDESVMLGLGLTEGIETALATMQRYGWRPVWAAGSASGIRSFPVLAGVETLTVFADADDGGTCLEAARSCLERWAAAGREGEIRPSLPGTDFADLAGRAA
jgi:hypothetical protein